VLKAETRNSSELDLEAILGQARERAAKRTGRSPGAASAGVEEHRSRDAGHTNS
jgi:hypothetical protein